MSVVRTLLLLALCAGAARGQSKTVELQQSGGVAVRLTSESFPGAVRPGGFGFLRLGAENVTTTPQRVHVEVEESSFGRSGYRAEIDLDVDPRVGASATLPLPFAYGYLMVRAGVERGPTVFVDSIGGGRGSDGISVLAVVPPKVPASAWQSWFDSILAPGGAAGHAAPKVSSLSIVDPRRLPTDWRLFSGYDLLLVDGSLPALDSEAQSSIADFVLAGGNLVVCGGGAMHAGRLLDLVRERRTGLGHLLILEDERGDDPAALTTSALTKMTGFLSDNESSPLKRLAAQISAPVHPAFAVGLEIPGVGSAPLRGFLLVVLVFAILVGPVNHFVLRRKRRMGLLLVTVPLGGLCATCLILVWGIVAQGFEVKQAERWLTVLDQPARRASSFGTRTLFAGSSIDRLRPRPGTWVCNMDLADFDSLGEAVLQPLTDGTLEGGLVPSRSVTTLGEVSVGPERARLRFRRDGSAREILAEAELQPLGTDIVMRDFDGSWFVGASGTRLAGVTEEAAAKALAALAENLVMRERSHDNEYRMRYGYAPSHGITGWQPFDFLTSLSGDGAAMLRPGSYVARVARSPGADDLGVSANTLASCHVVVGFLGQEDVVD